MAVVGKDIDWTPDPQQHVRHLLHDCKSAPMRGKDVFIAIGGNLSSETHGPPLAVMRAAVRVLPTVGVVVRRCSRWYCSAAVPPSDQPKYVNGVLDVDTHLQPEALLDVLHAVEAQFGRVRSAPNAARVLDLDLLACGQRVLVGRSGLQLPHPRLHTRAFVLKPLAELAPQWRHPQLGLSVAELLAALPPGQRAEPIEGEDG